MSRPAHRTAAAIRQPGRLAGCRPWRTAPADTNATVSSAESTSLAARRNRIRLTIISSLIKRWLSFCRDFFIVASRSRRFGTIHIVLRLDRIVTACRFIILVTIDTVCRGQRSGIALPSEHPELFPWLAAEPIAAKRGGRNRCAVTSGTVGALFIEIWQAVPTVKVCGPAAPLSELARPADLLATSGGQRKQVAVVGS